MYTDAQSPQHNTVFEKVTPVYKKSPRDSPRARGTGWVTPQFSRLGGSLRSFTCNAVLAYKHKNNVINTNVSLRVTTVDMTHFATGCIPRARGTRVQNFVNTRCVCYSTRYAVGYPTLKIVNASR